MVKARNLFDDFIEKSNTYPYSYSNRKRNNNQTDWIKVFLDVIPRSQDRKNAIESILRKVDGYIMNNDGKFSRDNVSEILLEDCKEELDTLKYYLMTSGQDKKHNRNGRVRLFYRKTLPNVLFRYFQEK